jgi:fatty acid desaturase
MFGAMFKRVALAAATAFLAINLWTGAPLLALWAGSQVESETSLTMGALLVVLAVFIVLIVAMTLALTWLSNTYDHLIGRP